MGPDAMIIVLWMLSCKSAFSLSSFIFIKRLFNSYSLSVIRVVSSAYLRLLIFLPAILSPACASRKIFPLLYSFGGFPGGSSAKEPGCQCKRHKRWVLSLGWEDPLEKGMTTQSRILAWNPMDWGAWRVAVHKVAKSWTWLKQLHTHTHACYTPETDTIY